MLANFSATGGISTMPMNMCELTGYRAFRYYTRAREYRALGPPRLPLRLLAPVLVAGTIGIFVSDVLLLAAGKSNVLLEIHKLSFIVLGCCS